MSAAARPAGDDDRAGAPHLGAGDRDALGARLALGDVGDQHAQAVAAHDRENPSHNSWGIGMAHFDMERLGFEEGEEILPGLHEREVEYLRREEWAVTAEDMLYRRSKLALHVPDGSARRLDDWLDRHPAA